MSNEHMQNPSLRGVKAMRAVGVQVEGFHAAFVVRRFELLDYILVPEHFRTYLVGITGNTDDWHAVRTLKPETEEGADGISGIGSAAVWLPCVAALEFLGRHFAAGKIVDIAKVHPAVRAVFYAAAIVSGGSSALDPRPDLSRPSKKKLTEKIPSAKMLPPQEVT